MGSPGLRLAAHASVLADRPRVLVLRAPQGYGETTPGSASSSPSKYASICATGRRKYGTASSRKACAAWGFSAPNSARVLPSITPKSHSRRSGSRGARAWQAGSAVATARERGEVQIAATGWAAAQRASACAWAHCYPSGLRRPVCSASVRGSPAPLRYVNVPLCPASPSTRTGSGRTSRRSSTRTRAPPPYCWGTPMPPGSRSVRTPSARRTSTCRPASAAARHRPTRWRRTSRIWPGSPGVQRLLKSGPLVRVRLIS